MQIIEPNPIGGIAEDTPVEDIPSSELLRAMESGKRVGTTGNLVEYRSELDKRLEDQQEQDKQEKVLEESTQPRSERFRRLSRAREEQQGYYFAKDSDYDVRLTEENVGRAKQVFRENMLNQPRPVEDPAAKIRTQKILESQRLAEEKDKRELEEGTPSFLESQLDTDKNTMEDIQQYLKDRSNKLRKSNTLQ